MASLNKVEIIGYLGQEPDIRYTSNGDCAATISVATTESWKDKQTGQKQEKTEWHRIGFFGRLAEVVRDYTRKGSQVYVCGRLQTRKFQDKQTGQDRYVTEIRADEFLMLDRKPDGSVPPVQQRKAPQDNFVNDDVPF